MTNGIALEEYIRLTLLSIAKAVKEAQNDEEVGEYIGRVKNQSDVVDESKNYITEVSFDIATTVEAADQKVLKAGIKVPSFGGFGGSGKAETSNSNISRIAFHVPLAIPRPQAQIAHDAKRAEDRRQRDNADTNRIINSTGWMAT